MTSRDCRHFDRRLQAFLGGRLPPTEIAWVALHAKVCTRCEELLRFARGASPASLEAPAGMIHTILERTSGSACASAESLLAQSFDRSFTGEEGDLLRAHVRDCTGCARTERSLARQAADLAAFSAIEPDGRFLADVLSRTVPVPSRRVATLSWWGRLLERPRFAWELAYVGAMVFWLVLGPTLPLSASVPELPLASQREAVFADARAMGGDLWQATGKRGVDAASNLANQVRAAYLGVRAETGDLARHTDDLTTALVALDAAGAAEALAGLGDDLRATWKRLRGTGEDASLPARENPADRN